MKKIINIATGHSAEAKTWKNHQTPWVEFVQQLQKPIITREQYADYLSMQKKEQGKIKDVGGYVCGILENGRRIKSSVQSRSALTLDLDFAPYDLWGELILLFNCAMVLHSTHKHSQMFPRYRLIVPLDRDVTPDEYVAIARKFAATVDIEYFDPTTFDVNRLMFWPSVAQDGEYIFEEQKGAFLRADKILAQYTDWTNISEWSFSEKTAAHVQTEKGKKLADPLAKDNIVGYFCNAYDIHTAIAEFLPDVYEKVDDNRYTFLAGSTACGLVTYDDLFAYSHHGSDPASEQCCNAFDLVRIHKFGNADVSGNTAKSYSLMSDFCRTLDPVKTELAKSITQDFGEYLQQGPDFKDDPFERVAPKEEKSSDVEDWKLKLEINKFNKYENSAGNIRLIMQNDPRLRDRLRYNAFSYKRYVLDPYPWPTSESVYPRQFRDVDTAGYEDYIERVYGIKAPQIIANSILLESERNSYHPVRKYFDSLEWDGVSRIDNLLRDCFKAEDNQYTREVSRKWLVAAVKRVYEPGCKYDTVIVLVGEEGTRKSSFFQKLGMEWASDSFTSLEGNKPYEQIQGKLIVEIAELSAFDKAESNQIKHFITKQIDTCRFAYRKEVLDYPRQCVFGATSNNRSFLRDEGNRRFWPVSVQTPKNSSGPLDVMSSEFDAMISQIWAEAIACYQLGESLILSREAEEIAEEERAKHTDRDDRAGMVERYLNMEVPKNWERMSTLIRIDYVNNPDAYKGKDMAERYVRDTVCAAEIWCECFGKKKEDLNLRTSREISVIMRGVKGWSPSQSSKLFMPYGRQRYYERKK